MQSNNNLRDHGDGDVRIEAEQQPTSITFHTPPGGSVTRDNHANALLTMPLAYTICKPHIFGLFTTQNTKLSRTPSLSITQLQADETSPHAEAIKELTESIAQMQSDENTQSNLLSYILWTLALIGGLLLIVQQSVNDAKNWTPAPGDAFNATMDGIQKSLVFITASLGSLSQNRRINASNLKESMIQELEQTFATKYNGPR